MSEVTGKLTVKNESQTFGSKGFRKREFVITTDSQYPQEIQIELIQDKCDLLNNFNIGDNLKVSYNLNGRKWISPQGEAKYFNSIQGWRIEKLADVSNAVPNNPAPVMAEGIEDDIPF